MSKKLKVINKFLLNEIFDYLDPLEKVVYSRLSKGIKIKLGLNNDYIKAFISFIKLNNHLNSCNSKSIISNEDLKLSFNCNLFKGVSAYYDCIDGQHLVNAYCSFIILCQNRSELLSLYNRIGYNISSYEYLFDDIFFEQMMYCLVSRNVIIEPDGYFKDFY